MNGGSLRSIIPWLVILFIVFMLVVVVRQSQLAQDEIPFTSFVQKVEAGEIAKVTIDGREITGEYRSPPTEEPRPKFLTYAPDWDKLVDLLNENDVEIKATKPDQGLFFSTIIAWLPFFLLIGVWLFLMRQMQTGGNKALSFGKSKARLSSTEGKKVTFKDVAGVDEAKEELREIIEFLKDPQKFTKLGGKIPKGVLLMGWPGTGKTLLARAVAGEANVPFFSISGSDFVEMFVGVGASRVRDLFEQGKKHAPCLIFIDEIDAVGRHRGAGLGGGHDEREQTLNQLLVEMDGFESNEGVILIAATNRPDVLDPALLRPGRFDRRVMVDRPDVKGREGILAVHTRNTPLDEDVDLNILARSTPGFSGADLANLVNEAALNAARYDKKSVAMADFEHAKDKVLMGSERKSLIISDAEKRVTAYHEAGHALVATLLPFADPVHKVTIIPRGQALGLTQSLPTEDKYNYSMEYMNDTIAMCMGGRIAEEIFFGQITTGAGNDIERATQLARRMVCEFGMSKLGPLTFGKRDEAVFLGRDFGHTREYSEDTAIKIDDEVRRLVMENYDRARELVVKNKDGIDRIAQALLDREVVDGSDIRRLIDGELTPEDLAKSKDDETASDAEASLATDSTVETAAPSSDPPTGDGKTPRTKGEEEG